MNGHPDASRLRLLCRVLCSTPRGTTPTACSDQPGACRCPEIEKEIVRANANEQIVFIDNKANKGKAACLNQGIRKATGEFVACMDADSMCARDVIKKTVPYFENQKIGAVTVTVEVNKPKRLLEKVVELEFILGLSLFLRVFSFINCIHVTPGPFSIYRKSMMDEINGFDETNITEDLEIAYRIRKAGYKMDCCMAARVKTNVPDNFKGLYKQRRRWYTGAIYTILQHRSMLLRKKYGLWSFFMTYNYSIILTGILLFITTIFLALKNWITDVSFYRFTNFNFFQHMQWPEFDLLGISVFYILGITGFAATIIILMFGTRASVQSLKKRKLGAFGYLYLYFLYQIFWISSIIHVITGKKVKWR